MKSRVLRKRRKGRGRVVVDKCALVHDSDGRLVNAIGRICDAMAVTEELVEHYRGPSLIGGYIWRVVQSIRREFPEKYHAEGGDRENRLPRDFRKAFANEEDEYLIKAARDTGARFIITDDAKVLGSPGIEGCKEYYRKIGLEGIVTREDYAAMAP